MSLFSFFKKNKESYSLVFNIGSGSVSGSIVSFTEAPGETVTAYFKETFPFQDQISVSRHLELMRHSLGQLVGKIQKANSYKISRIFYVFSSPWSVSQTKIIKIKENKPVKITESYINKIIDEQEKKFQSEITNVGRIIEKKIIQIKINGYTLNDFYGKTAKDIEIAVFFTIVPDEILKTVDTVVGKYFNVSENWCHSFPLAVLTVIKNLFPQKDDFINVDVSEEITDISIVEDGIMLNSVSIPFGRNDFMRELSKILKVSEEVADSQIRMHCAGQNDQLAAMKLSVAMDTAASSWQSMIKDVLNGFRDKIYVPDTIFLLAGEDLSLFLKDKLQKQDFNVTILNNKRIKSPIRIEDAIFKIQLMFLDDLYKI